MKSKEIITLLLKEIEAPLSDREKQRLYNLLQENESERRFYEYARIYFRQSDYPVDETNKEGVRQEIERKIRTTTFSVQPKPALKIRKVGLVAAIVVLILGIAVGLLYRPEHKQEITYTEVVAPFGQKSRVWLPDSTLVCLNAGTSLKYASDFGLAERKVWLDGEAYFEVRKQNGKTFKVKTRKIEVNVKGTVFNVKDYKNEPEVVTHLFEGSIDLELSAIQEKLNLLPGYKVVYNSATGTYQQSKHTGGCDWLNSVYRFENERLENLVNVLNRVFDTDIRFRDEKLKDYRYTGVISEEKGLQRILLLLKVSADIQIEQENNLIYLNK